VQIKVGYELIYDCVQPTPMILNLSVHHTRASDIVVPDLMSTNPRVRLSSYRDQYGNWCTRLTAPPGRISITGSGVVRDNGLKDPADFNAGQSDIEDLPDEALVFLLGSRYCDTDLLSEVAWSLFDRYPPGWSRVQAICDFVHQHISFGYEHASSSKTASQAYNSRQGVCRDFAHLAVTFCRCMNIPARYCAGYLSDIGVPPPYAPMDFAGWFEAYIGGRWYTFDPRNNEPRMGRILIARGRDAADTAISCTFGPNTLVSFAVTCDEIAGSN